MVQVVLPNDANPLGYILGGTVMHLIDIAAAIATFERTVVSGGQIVAAVLDDQIVAVRREIGGEAEASLKLSALGLWDGTLTSTYLRRDTRVTDPFSGKGFMEQLEEHLRLAPAPRVVAHDALQPIDFAAHHHGVGVRGISSFIIEKGTPGFSAGTKAASSPNTRQVAAKP